jgi:hypothetical protein
VLRNKAITPLLAAAQELKPARQGQNPGPLDQHYEALAPLKDDRRRLSFLQEREGVAQTGKKDQPVAHIILEAVQRW